jgi:hypothetical protein
VDSAGEVHADGEIWSRALFDINASLGRTTADTVILEAQFGFAPNTTFAAAAQQIVADGAGALRRLGRERLHGGVPGARHPLVLLGRG